MYLVFALSVIAGTGLILAHAYALREKRADERASTAYVRGFDACSRVRDREETQERKERLFMPNGHIIPVDGLSLPESPEPLQSRQDGAVDPLKFN